MRFIRRASFCLCFALCFWLIACGDACPKGDTERQISRAEPVFIRDSPYAKGKMYHMTNTYNPEQVVKVLTVSGSDYEMGQAIGDLLKNEIHAAIDSVLPYYKEKYGKLLRNYLPGFIVDILMWMLDYVGYFALELTWFMTRTFTNRRVFDELHGVANATGLDYMRLVKLSMFPELIKAKCSLVGAWGDATPDRNVYYLRALDWDSHNPVTGVPVIIFYRPSEKGAIPYANIGYAGLFGVLTAVSKAGLAIGEKAWYPNDYDNAETRFVGTPWHYVLRDIAEFAQDLESATKMLIDAKKTATIHLGISTRKDNTYRGFHYAGNFLKTFHDKNMQQNDSIHPYLPNVVYWDKHLQPTKDSCVGALLKKQWGNITPLFLSQNITALHRTGNAHWVTFDVNKNEIYFGFSVINKKEAYEVPMFFLDLNKFF